MRARKRAAQPLIAAIGAALLLPLRKKSPSSLAALSATLLLALSSATTVLSTSQLALPAIAFPCTNAAAPLLSVNRFAFGCLKATRAPSFFLAVFFRSTSSFGPTVWIANPTHPVSGNASLQLLSSSSSSSSSAQLILSDPPTSSSPAWRLSFSASSRSPVSIALDDSGNLLILDSTNSSLWQSFLHPLDLLLPGQIMTPGMQLVAGSQSAPTTINTTEIVTYTAKVIEPARFAFFADVADSGHSLPYSVFSLDADSGHSSDAMNNSKLCSSGTVDSSGFSTELQFSYDATELLLRSCVANVSMNRSITFGARPDFLRLDPDGNMRGYKYDYTNAAWHVVYNWFVNNPNITYGICSLPNVCGPYGMCDAHRADNNKCSCPHISSTYEQLFLPVNKSDLRQGCRLVHPLDVCSSDQKGSHFFIELQGADYFANEYALSNVEAHIFRSTEQECVASCAGNCTCKAAFYRADIGACFQYEQVLSIIGVGNATKLIESSQIIAGNKTKKAAYVTQHLASRSAPLAAQLMRIYAAQSDLTRLVHVRNSTDVFSNYVGFLKVKITSTQGTESSSRWPLPARAGKKKYLLIIGIGGAGAGLVLISVTIGLLCVFCKRRRRRRFKALKDEGFYTTSTSPVHHKIEIFTFAQLQEASGDFKYKLGVGGFGSVYKGTLPDGSIVAIKQLENAIRSDREFESQVAFLHSLNHPNLVRLTGVCSNGSRRFLTSDYMSHGSLDAWLFHTKPIFSSSSSSIHASSALLTWSSRFRIACDVANALAFLHENNLVHLAVKPQNILLDDAFAAKLSDYGLSRLMDQEDGCMIMHMRGATGYMAPEWLQHACATEKSDVYSYGMVLMEMLGGRRNLDLSKERESWFFPLLATKMYKEGRELEVLDESLTKSSIMGESECEQAKRVMKIAFCCIVENSAKRPDIVDVLCMLQGHQDVPEPPLPISFNGCSVHANSAMESTDLDDNHHFLYHDYYDQSGASSPSCFDISLASEPSCAAAAHSSWSSISGNSHLDDCTLLLPSQS